MILIGYSHGGTVALMASNLAKRKPTGLITVATPFIEFKRVEKGERRFAAYFFFKWISAIVAGVIFGALSWLLGTSWLVRIVTFPLTMGIGVVLAVLALTYIIDRGTLLFHARTRRLMRNNDIPKFVLYIKDDEALGWLFFLSNYDLLEKLFLPVMSACVVSFLATVISLLIGAEQVATVCFVILLFCAISPGVVLIAFSIARGVLSMTKYGFGETLARTILGERLVTPWPEPINLEDYRIVLTAGGLVDGKGFRHSRIMLSDGLVFMMGECLKRICSMPSFLDKFPVGKRHLAYWFVREKNELPGWILSRAEAGKQLTAQPTENGA
ncbi:hypothetical protein BCCGELA001_30305 [Bradyrhizobium sp. CCGE-LA001]|nr:hypothetical protein BCCGELA001_30305 [Bradyrhizobium sp. CCGE-LA001]